MEEELQDMSVVFDEPAFKGVESIVAARPDRFRYQIVNPGDQDVLVMRTVKDGCDAPGWRDSMDPPEKIMIEFDLRRLLERYDIAPLRIHGTEDMIDRPVLSPGVKGLQTDQERPISIGVEQFLQIPQFLSIMLDLLGRILVSLVMVLEFRIEILQLDVGSGQDSEAFQIFQWEAPVASLGKTLQSTCGHENLFRRNKVDSLALTTRLLIASPDVYHPITGRFLMFGGRFRLLGFS
jgi:hypothetical protein